MVHVDQYLVGGWYTNPSKKYDRSQLDDYMFPRDGNNKQIPNHQPDQETSCKAWEKLKERFFHRGF